MPVNSSVLLLVTQALFINACFLPPYVPSLKILRAHLTLPSMIKENEASPVDYPADKQGGGGRRLCVSAAIGFCYNGQCLCYALSSYVYTQCGMPNTDIAFLVATRSHLLPSHQDSTHIDNAMDMGLPIDITQSSKSDERVSYDSDVWGEEVVIDFCEVGIQIDPSNALSKQPQPLHRSSRY